MNSIPVQSLDKLVVDSIHGDIHLSPIEQRVIDTASFQRLRHLRQLGFAQATYPNATHTRFAHSLGVLGIMEHIVRVARQAMALNDEKIEDIRLAGLLHDIGHYPYSHLMEKIDKVQLTEDFLTGPQVFRGNQAKYPDHEVVGEYIVTHQQDLINALGGLDRAKRIAELFTRKTAVDPQLSKLIHSSLDMDRLDCAPRLSEPDAPPVQTETHSSSHGSGSRQEQTMSLSPEGAVSQTSTSATSFDFLAPPQNPDEIGRLGPYRVLGLLGAGGMRMLSCSAMSP